MKANPLFREYVLQEPQSYYHTLGLGQELTGVSNVRETDYIFVLSGSLEVVCEKFLSSQN